MKKILAIGLMILLPVAAWAGMSSLAETDLAEITGTMGVSITIVDWQQDLSIASLTWGDVNTGSRWVAGQAVNMSPGYININNIAINKNTMTLNAVTAPNGVYADPIKIDVVSLGQPSATQPFVFMADRTAVIISLPDMLQTIDSISLGSISLDTAPATVQTWAASAGSNGQRGSSAFYNALNQGGQYYYVNTTVVANSHQLGQLYIQGFKQITYSHLEGYDTNGSLPVSQRPGEIIIFAHNAAGGPTVSGGGGGGGGGGGSITVSW
jgi:hypothetical protein